jgi:hypothetical protein
LPRICQSVCVLPCYQGGTEPLRLRFEHVVGPPDGWLGVSGELPALLGVSGTALDEALEAGLPVVMALTKPNAGDPVATRCARLSAIPSLVELEHRLGCVIDRSDKV